MAVIAPTSLAGPGQRPAVINTLTASDTFVYVPNSGQELVLYNTTAGALSPTIGSGTITIAVPGIPAVAVTSYAVGSIAIGAGKVIPLDSISAYLVNGGGSPTISAGTGLIAFLLNNN